MSDLIKREDAIEAVWKPQVRPNGAIFDALKAAIESEIKAIPSADRPSGEVDAVKEYEHQVHNLNQGYITLGEFDKRVEPLRHLYYDRPQGWIPCSERLPEDSGDYLVCPSDSVLEDYSDFSEVMIMPYDADCEAFGWWTERYDPISLGYLDSDFNEFEVLAWMPLPEPWKGADDENKD